MLCSTISFAEQFTLYVVYKSSLTGINLTNFNASLTKGKFNQRQPALNTKIIDVGHPDFQLLSISTQTTIESNIVNTLETKGIIKRIEETEIAEEVRHKQYPENM